jgi:ubiquinone/menaquinone biosynthesis C-methylase UbiE
LAVGEHFERIGQLERELLIQWGLERDSYLIDVGCGSGRLASALTDFLQGSYLGIDVSKELLEFARRLVPVPSWRFELAEGLTIPEANERADMVCFFSVFTHLLHEASFLYLQEAKRVVKAGGKIIFSFFDFTVAAHWDAFDANLKDIDKQQLPANVFIGKEVIQVWASRLGLQVLCIQDGDQPHIPLSSPVIFADGTAMSGLGKLGKRGQSVCVLSKG